MGASELYPRFHGDAKGNIIAYSNGNAVTIVNASRHRDRYTDFGTECDIGAELYALAFGQQPPGVQLRGRGDGETGDLGKEHLDGGIGLPEPEIQGDSGGGE